MFKRLKISIITTVVTGIIKRKYKEFKMKFLVGLLLKKIKDTDNKYLSVGTIAFLIVLYVVLKYVLKVDIPLI
jgi:hypothetical protein